MEWLHQGCDSDLLADFVKFGAGDFPFKKLSKKCFKIVDFFALASRSGCGAAFFDVLHVVLRCFAIHSLQITM